MNQQAAPQAEVRLDKWLQIARIYKTRTQATDAITAGHVRMDGKRAKAGRVLKLEDQIEVAKGSRRFTLTVKGLAERSIPAAEARELYHMVEEQQQLSGLDEEQRDYVRMMNQMARAQAASRKGRPTKKERRDLDRARTK